MKCLAILALTLATASAAERVVINEIYFAPPDKKPLEFVELLNAGDAPADLAGWTFEKFVFPPGTTLAPGGFLVLAQDPAAVEKEFKVKALGPLPGKLSSRGETLTLSDAAKKPVEIVKYGAGFPWPTASVGLGSSLERISALADGSVAGHWRASGYAEKPTSKRPTPGAANSVAATSAPPACAWVIHTPQQPAAGQAVSITAALTDREGVASATLQVQLVEPGAYLRKSDEDYEKRWQDFPMHDDGLLGDVKAGDNIWTALLPPELQQNRRLIRYRIVATDKTGASVRLPYADDPCPNFAYYVWNGPTAYTAAVLPGKTPPVTFSADFLRTRPTFTVLANDHDVRHSQWDSGYNHKRLLGTLVYEGRVFDHLEFNNRGSGSTYVAGKNKWGFHFLHTHELPMRDPWGRLYKRPWNSFALNACASPWVQINRGMAGLDEAISFRSYQLAGVPASDTIPVVLRVITSKEEQGATQFDGDLWGLYLVVEDPDGAWLKNHALPDGITFKPEDGPKHVPSSFGKDARAVWDEFNAGPKGDKTEWWRTHMDLPSYYSFHAINALVSNVDIRPGANHAFYQSPARGWSPVPWDVDMMFIPRTHQAGFIDQARCLEIPALSLEYKNRVREIMDLFASDPSPSGGQIGQLVAEYAHWIVPTKAPADNWATLDQARWNDSPRTNDKGAFYRNPASQNMQGGSFKRTLATADFAGFCKYITDFCTDSRSEKNYALNDANPAGYGYGRLLRESEDPAIPATPSVRYSGPTGFPAAALSFAASPFSDPQGTPTFAALQWRIAELATPATGPWLYELQPIWQSAELPQQGTDLRLPATVCQPGHTYRVRARMKDQTARWSHWSAPVQFTAR